MKRLPKCYGIIPARYGSTRFPGKALALIRGKPMFWHVFERARQCPELSNVVLATDDERIATAAKELDVPVLMTRKDHPNGTSRVMEAAEALGIPQDAVVVNIQGDEPVLNPAMLTELVRPLDNAEVQVSTLARRIDHKEAQSTNQVKVVFSKSGRALYFSRSIIPYHQEAEEGVFYGHIGLYAFRMSVLDRLVSLEQSPLERAEKLEQLRWLENSIPIDIVVTGHQSVGVDRPEDIQTVEQQLLKKRP